MDLQVSVSRSDDGASSLSVKNHAGNGVKLRDFLLRALTNRLGFPRSRRRNFKCPLCLPTQRVLQISCISRFEAYDLLTLSRFHGSLGLEAHGAKFAESLHTSIAEANQLNCQLLANALHPKRYHLEVSATATDSKTTLALLKENKPDVAIISAQLQDGALAGYTVLQELRAMQSKTRAIMLLEARTREPVVDAFRFGAHGVIFRDEPVETLGKCIHAVSEGQVWANSLHLGFLLEALSQVSPVRLQDARGSNLLTKREEDVARLVAEGMSNREISRHLKLLGRSRGRTPIREKRLRNQLWSSPNPP